MNIQLLDKGRGRVKVHIIIFPNTTHQEYGYANRFQSSQEPCIQVFHKMFLTVSLQQHTIQSHIS